ASCQKEYVKINIAGTSDVYHFCISDSNTNPITAFDNVTITHYVSTNYYRYTGFTLEYAIKTIECLNRNSFECDNDTCVSEDRVCDGVKDCKNRADEIGCERVYQRSPGGERGGRVLVETEKNCCMVMEGEHPPGRRSSLLSIGRYFRWNYP
ncbi:unnamed protein product, partial [Larinioides sclopetarius]